ncbi:copper resistance CopC/CopD family protein [Alicyclobacillus fructus]|uniref:copper resistance CopC/CopD family protein n=1 Tax=Alicyclobacillus fructus TaxID=2816082 RepID=UPI001A8C6A5B|nr:copper resistance protein CopC [Alicyclobacillus fructus]
MSIRPNRFWLSVIAWCAALMAALGLHAPTASAHAYVVHSSPAPGQSLKSSPGRIEIEFDEPVQLLPGGLTVTNVDNQRVDLGDGHRNPSDSRQVDVDVPSRLPRGLYTVHWQVISADGHLVSGSIPFGVGINVQSLTLGATEQGYRPGVWMVIDRVLTYLGLALVVGGAIGLRAARTALPIDENRLGAWFVAGGWAALWVGVLFNLPLEAAITWNVHGLASFSPRYLARTLNFTVWGYLWVIELMLVAVIPAILAALSSSRPRQRLATAALPVFAVPVTLALQGHAMSEPHPWLPALAMAVHGLAASVWIGGIAQMLALILQTDRISTHDDAVLIHTVRSFGRIAAACAFAVAVTGAYSALLHIPTWYALTHTGYGVALLVKLGLVLCLLFFASMHALSPRPKRGAYRVWLSLELAVSVGIFAITSVLTNLPTGDVHPGPVNQVKSSGPYAIHLIISPNEAGPNTFTVQITKDGRADAAIQQVEIALASASAPGSSAASVRLTPHGQGIFVARSLALSGGGLWDADVQVVTDDFDVVNVDFRIHVGTES